MTFSKTANTFELGFALADELRKGSACDRARAIDLIERGASLTTFNLKDDMTPLMHACAQGFADVVQAMADRKTDMNICAASTQGNAAIHYAAANCSLQSAACIKTLSDNGADINALNSAGDTPLQLAIKCGATPAVLALLEVRADTEIRAKEPPHVTPLIAAVIANNEDMLAGLLKSKANIEATDDDACTALHYAAILKSKPLVTMLIHHGANTQAKIHSGETPAEIARIMDAPDIAEWIEKLSEAREKMHTLSAVPLLKKIKINPAAGRGLKNDRKMP